tara:strand:- start:119 stop:430 length:312 start_codon:yes stop_codon:yes gene_type:complete
MATFTEKSEYDKIEIIGDFKGVHVRKINIVLKDGNPISSTFERYVLNPLLLDESGNFIDNPLTKEPDGVTDIPENIKTVCNLFWTNEVKNEYRTFLESELPSS